MSYLILTTTVWGKLKHRRLCGLFLLEDWKELRQNSNPGLQMQSMCFGYNIKRPGHPDVKKTRPFHLWTYRLGLWKEPSCPVQRLSRAYMPLLGRSVGLKSKPTSQGSSVSWGWRKESHYLPTSLTSWVTFPRAVPWTGSFFTSTHGVHLFLTCSKALYDVTIICLQAFDSSVAC